MERNGINRALSVFLAAACLLSGFSSATANNEASLVWLISQAKTDGSVSRNGDIATPFQSTAEVLRTLRLNGQTSGSVFTQAREFLAESPETQTEYLSRRIVEAVEGGGSVSALVAQLKDWQAPIIGGFGSKAAHHPSVIDTAFALEALAISGSAEANVTNRAIHFLLENQAADGSWSDNDNPASLPLTALVTSALSLFASNADASAMLKRASTYLLASRESNGLWGSDYFSSLALIAIGQSVMDRSVIADSILALNQRQSPDGSWQGDVYVTALALRALALANGSVQSPNGPFSVSDFVAQNPAGGAGQLQVFEVSITNNTNDHRPAVVVGYIVDSSGAKIAAVSPYVPGASSPQSSFEFAARQSLTLQFSWNPNQAPAGQYRLIVDVVRPNTFAHGNARGEVLEEFIGDITVAQTEKIMGSLALNPPLTQSGSLEPVQLDVLVVNAGNVPLFAEVLSLTVRK